MADDSGESNGGSNSGGSDAGSQAGQDGQAPGGSQESPGGTSDSPSADELTRQIAELRKENAANRTKLKKFEDEKLSEAEKLQNRIKELEADQEKYQAERNAATVQAMVTDAATKAGAFYPDTFHRLLDLQMGEDGNPTNLDSAINAAREKYPALFSRNSADGASGRGAQPNSKGWLRESINRR